MDALTNWKSVFENTLVCIKELEEDVYEEEGFYYADAIGMRYTTRDNYYYQDVIDVEDYYRWCRVAKSLSKVC